MKLIYRGVRYDEQPQQTQLINRRQQLYSHPYTLSYRGTPYQVDPQALAPQLVSRRVSETLIYRGVTYPLTREQQPQYPSCALSA